VCCSAGAEHVTQLNDDLAPPSTTLSAAGADKKHTYNSNQTVNMTVTDLIHDSCLNGWTCGNIAASPSDIARFHYDLHHGQIVSEKSLAEMLAFKPMTVGWQPQLYGLGMMHTWPYQGKQAAHVASPVAPIVCLRSFSMVLCHHFIYFPHDFDSDDSDDSDDSYDPDSDSGVLMILILALMILVLLIIMLLCNPTLLPDAVVRMPVRSPLCQRNDPLPSDRVFLCRTRVVPRPAECLFHHRPCGGRLWFVGDDVWLESKIQFRDQPGEQQCQRHELLLTVEPDEPRRVRRSFFPWVA
jgi:hypothetical protein